MIGKNYLLPLLFQVLPDDTPAEILVQHVRTAKLAFAGNSVTMAGWTRNIKVFIRVEVAGRIAAIAVDGLEQDKLRQAMARARENASKLVPGPELVLTGSMSYKDMALWHQPSAEFRCADGMALLQPALDLAAQANQQASGELVVQQGELALANTAGMAAWTNATSATFDIIMGAAGAAGSGWASCCHRNVRELDIMGASLEALAKSQGIDYTQSLAPGYYTVVFEPAAVARLVELLGETVCNGLIWQEGRLPFARLGQRYLGENITLWDDGLDQRGMAMPFDFQGVPKQRLNLFNRGVLKHFVLDNTVAAAINRDSTGHAQPPWHTDGPVPRHLFMEPGNAMLDDMIVSTQNGILISRLHNVIIQDGGKLLVSGFSCNGALRIENGKLTAALPDLQFELDLVHALNNVEMVGDSTRLYGGLWHGTTVPALKIHEVHITGLASMPEERAVG